MLCTVKTFQLTNSGCCFDVMQDILKHTERAGEDTKDLQRALEVMCIIPKAANDMMNVGRLQGFEVRQFPLLLFSCAVAELYTSDDCPVQNFNMFCSFY